MNLSTTVRTETRVILSYQDLRKLVKYACGAEMPASAVDLNIDYSESGSRFISWTTDPGKVETEVEDRNSQVRPSGSALG